MKRHRRQSFVLPREGQEGQYGILVPLGAWHSVVMHEASTILEVKEGAYGKQNGETIHSKGTACRLYVIKR